MTDESDTTAQKVENEAKAIASPEATSIAAETAQEAVTDEVRSATHWWFKLGSLPVLAVLGGLVYVDTYCLFPRIKGWAPTIVIGVFEAAAAIVVADVFGVRSVDSFLSGLLAKVVAPKDR